MAAGTVCLNCIVKNESHVIERMLNSIKHIIDEFVIIDTGSTDNTIEILKSYPLQGHVIKREFSNFADTRNFALDTVRRLSSCDWILLTDADMIFESTITKEGLLMKIDDHNAVSILQQRGRLEYRNVRLIRKELVTRYIGPTHEVLCIDCTIKDLPKGFGVFKDLGDGGCSVNKFKRDIELLKKHLLTIIPNDEKSRCIFYLAESYRNANFIEEAISQYTLRFMLGGWVQELFYCAYQLSRCFLALEKPTEAITWAEKASQLSPRSEPFYYLCKWHREKSLYGQAYVFLARARCHDKPSDDCLFVETDVYDYLIDFEDSILRYYIEKDVVLKKGICGLLSGYLNSKTTLPQNVYETVHLNSIYYAPLIDFPVIVVQMSGIVDDYNKYHWSTPTLLHNNGDDSIEEYIRINNYFITQDGRYIWNESHIECKTLVRRHDKWTSLDVNLPKHLKVHNDKLVKGLEDVRLHRLNDNKTIVFTAITADLINGDDRYRRVVFGNLNAETLNVKYVLPSPYKSKCEKNWVLFNSKNGDLGCIYKWFPLEAGIIEKGKLSQLVIIDTYTSLRYMRGSTNGQWYNDCIWFITHSVAKSDHGTYYMHYLIALDELLHLVGIGGPFKLTEGPIEFCNGLVIQSNGMMTLGFSHLDSSSMVARINHYEFLRQVGFNYTVS